MKATFTGGKLKMMKRTRHGIQVQISDSQLVEKKYEINGDTDDRVCSAINIDQSASGRW